jgi:hypothetical protein
MKLTTIIVKGAYLNLSASRCEFHSIVDQIPKHLLEADRISKDLVCLRVQLG